MMKFKAFTPETVRVYKLGENGMEEHVPQVAEPSVGEDLLSGQVVSQYKLSAIAGENEQTGPAQYQQVKKRFGSFAATDPDRVPNSVKDSRFVLNPASRDRLAIADEERRVIDRRIAEQSAGAREKAQSEGFEAGRLEGLELGKKIALDEFAVHAGEKLAALDELVGSFDSLKSAIFQANQKYLMSLVVRLTRSIVLKELKTDEQYLERLVKNLIERVGVRENIRIKVSPEDAEKISALKGGVENHFGNLHNLQIDVSSQVRSGGCLLETSWNTIDAMIDTQIDSLKEALVDPIHPEVPEALEAKSRLSEPPTEQAQAPASDPTDDSGNSEGGSTPQTS